MFASSLLLQQYWQFWNCFKPRRMQAIGIIGSASISILKWRYVFWYSATYLWNPFSKLYMNQVRENDDFAFEAYVKNECRLLFLLNRCVAVRFICFCLVRHLACSPHAKRNPLDFWILLSTFPRSHIFYLCVRCNSEIFHFFLLIFEQSRR